MMTDRGVRVLTAYENKRVGQVIFPPGLLRDHLLRAGLVEPVKGDEPGPMERARRIIKRK